MNPIGIMHPVVLVQSNNEQLRILQMTKN